MDIVYKVGYADEKKAFDVDAGIDFVMSSEAKDRMGDVILSSAWKLDQFKKNPIALYQHDSNDPIGFWENVRIENKKLIGKLKLAAEGTSSDIDAIRALVKQGILRAVSVGFRALKYKEEEDVDGVVFTECDLFECSLVSIPANQEALSIARKFHANEKRLFVEPPKGPKEIDDLRKAALAVLRTSAVSLTTKRN
jgi:HK97 family phage prohead protease